MEEVDTRMPLMAHAKMEVIPAQDEMMQAFLIYWKTVWDSSTTCPGGEFSPAIYLGMYFDEKEKFAKYWKEAHDEE